MNTGAYRGNGRSEGFTLLEVSIAFVVIVVAMVGLLMVLANNMKIVEANRESTLVEEGVNDKLSEIKAHLFDDITTDYGAGGNPGNTFTIAGIPSAAGTVAIDATNQWLLDIALTVTWRGVYGDNQTYSHRTMITR